MNPSTKDTMFLWGWKDYQPTEDAVMTRERMAKLMRAWRRSATQGKRNFSFRITSRKAGRREYFVNAVGYDDFARFVVQSII